MGRVGCLGLSCWPFPGAGRRGAPGLLALCPWALVHTAHVLPLGATDGAGCRAPGSGLGGGWGRERVRGCEETGARCLHCRPEAEPRLRDL